MSRFRYHVTCAIVFAFAAVGCAADVAVWSLFAPWQLLLAFTLAAGGAGFLSGVHAVAASIERDTPG